MKTKPHPDLSGQQLQSFSGLHLNGAYRYVPTAPDDRQGEGCTMRQLARQTPKGSVIALVEFTDGHQRAVSAASLRSLREKYPLTPLELLDLGA